MIIAGWGNFPQVDAKIFQHWSIDQIQTFVQNSKSLVASGLFRSYGDSALNKVVFSSLSLNRILDFDPASKKITCEAGVSFKDLINFLAKYKLSLPTTPGTKFITLGGAIASDIHGKNHHKNGTFGQWVQSIRLITANGEIVNCSENENSDLFRATIGGMGLTGVILDATIKLVDLDHTVLDQTTLRARNLDHIFELFELNTTAQFSVGWLDTHSSGQKFGRGVLFIGNPNNADEPLILKNPKFNIPFSMPKFSLNKFSIGLLNNSYYFLNYNSKKIVKFDKFFYPLDAIDNWNRFYGKNGFFQYQFVVPRENSKKAIKKVLIKMQDKGASSFLTVLKLMGPKNRFLLSFPMEGYTLAMDLPVNRKNLEVAKELDKIVMDHNGRLYLTKDARMDRTVFEATYTELKDFLEIKSKIDPKNKFSSLQSVRLGINV